MTVKDSKKAKILLVDDQEGNLLSLSVALRNLDCEMIQKRSGIEALQFLENNEVALVILDIMMPVMDGFETAKKMRKLPNFGSTPIIFLTALLPDNEQVQKAYESGGADFLSKPIDNRILTSKVSVFLELYRTKTKIAEAQAQDLKLKSAALENSLNGFDIVNEEGQLIYANKSYLRMWGYDSLEEIVGTSPADHCADPTTPLKIIKELKEKGQCDIEFVAKRKDGSTFDVRMLAFLDRDSSGHEIYPSTSVDVTEQRRTSNALLEAKEEAERANELKSAFLANMSHEIRTPLGAMIGFADLLRDRELSEEERLNYTEILLRNGEQLSLLINDILDISKVEAGHLKLEFIEFNPEKIAASVISLMEMKAKEKNLNLNYELQPSTPKEVTSDPIRVRQVLLNLVGNAIKFTLSGSILIRSRGETNEFGKKITIFEVIDSGIGVPPEQAEHIFDMFVQADGSMTRRFGGTGIGLALSRKLAHSLGGEVAIKSSTSKGSTFQFSFIDQPERRDMTATQEIQEIGSARKALGSKVLAGANVLVVDDSSDNRTMIEMFLRKQGAKVENAEDGAQGVNKALNGTFDVVLMDIQMPGMDGYSATERLRSNGYSKPIIAITAHAMSEVRKKCLNVGCNDHLPKPIKQQELVAMVAKYLS